jgi:hypothetical protein
MSKALPVILTAVFLLVVVSRARARPKTDVVFLSNGDRITCEIKELKRGKLTVSTYAEGTISIEWDEIVGLTSQFYFRVETAVGRRVFGALQLNESGAVLVITGPVGSLSIDKIDVVEITPIEEGFWSRLDGSFSIGFSFTKASEVAQLSVNWNNKYRTERNLVDLKFSLMFTETGDGKENPTQRRMDLTATYYRLLRRKWTGQVSGSLQRNDELGLARRALIGFGTGASPLKSNRNILLLSINLALNTELAVDSTNVTASAEVPIGVSYSLFQYDHPKTDVNGTFDFFPSLTDDGRYRFELDLYLRRELVKDLFFEISFYTSFDNQPPSGGDPNADYGIVTSLGYSY